MKKLFQRIFSNQTFSILSIRIINTLVVTGLLIYLSRELSLEAYGLYTQFWLTLTLTISIGALGLSAVLYNFSIRGWIDFYRTLSRTYYFRYFSFTIILSIIAASYTAWGFEGFNTYIFLALCLLYLSAIISFVLENVLIVCQLSLLQLIINGIYALILLYIHYSFVEHQDFEQLFLSYAALQTTKAAIQWIIFHRAQNKWSASAEYEALPIFRPDNKNWIQMAINEVFQFIMRYLDKFIVNLLATKEMVAIYFNGRQDIPFLSALYTSIGHGLLIELSKRHHLKDEEVILQMKKRLKALGTIIITITVFAWVYSEEIFSVVFTEKYIESIPIFKMGLLLLPAQYLICITYILQYKHHAKIINKGAYFDAAFILILSFPMYYWLGPIGIILTIVVSTYLQNFYYHIEIAKVLHTVPHKLLPITSYLKYTIINLIIATVSYQLCQNWTSPTVTLSIGIICGGLLALILYILSYRKDKEIKAV